jgi:hypothetical protein
MKILALSVGMTFFFEIIKKEKDLLLKDKTLLQMFASLFP